MDSTPKEVNDHSCWKNLSAGLTGTGLIRVERDAGRDGSKKYLGGTGREKVSEQLPAGLPGTVF